MTDLSTKRVLLTGGGGFLGSHIVEQLHAAGCAHVIAPRKREYDLTSRRNIDSMLARYQPQIVIHAAASVGGIGANLENPGRFFYENAIMGIELIDACRQFSVEKIVVLGTICAYPKFTPVPFREVDIWSGYPEETNAPYGIAKKALLVQCQAYREQYGLNAIYLLPVNLYGPRDNFDLNASHVIPALIRKCADAVENGSLNIELWGDGSPTREFLYVTDAARAVVMATKTYNGSDPVNIGSGVEISIRELSERIAVLTGFSGQIRWDTSKPNGQPRRCLDVTRARTEFNFKAETSLADGLRMTIQWYFANREELVPVS